MFAASAALVVEPVQTLGDLARPEGSNARQLRRMSGLVDDAPDPIAPFAAADPLRVIPSIMIGSAITGAISMAVGAQLHVPHGGIFVLPMPNAVTGLLGYTVAIVVGTVVTAFALFLLKKPLESSAA